MYQPIINPLMLFSLPEHILSTSPPPNSPLSPSFSPPSPSNSDTNTTPTGPKAARYLLLLLSRLYTLKHVELQNIGAARGCCGILARSLRDAALTWAYCDLSGNKFDRLGMAEITWALMNNRSFRVLKLANCGAGPYYASSTDALPVNGVGPSYILHTTSLSIVYCLSLIDYRSSYTVNAANSDTHTTDN